MLTTGEAVCAGVGSIHECEHKVAQSCPTLCDPTDYSLPGSSVHGIFQARVLEWGATAFSNSNIEKYFITELRRESKLQP